MSNNQSGNDITYTLRTRCLFSSNGNGVSNNYPNSIVEDVQPYVHDFH